jgi:hypothetical protein
MTKAGPAALADGAIERMREQLGARRARRLEEGREKGIGESVEADL